MRKTLIFSLFAALLLFVGCDKNESNTNANPTNDTTSVNQLIVGGQSITITQTLTDLFPNGSGRYYVVAGAGTSAMVIFADEIPNGTSYTTTVNTIDAGKCRVVLQLDGGNEVYYANDGSTVSVSKIGTDKLKITFDTIGFTELGASGTPKTNSAKATFTCNKQ